MKENTFDKFAKIAHDTIINPYFLMAYFCFAFLVITTIAINYKG